MNKPRIVVSSELVLAGNNALITTLVSVAQAIERGETPVLPEGKDSQGENLIDLVV